MLNKISKISKTTEVFDKLNINNSVTVLWSTLSTYTRVYMTDQTLTLRKQISEITIANLTY